MLDGIDRSQGDGFENVYSWIETIPFSKGKRNSIKDFSDAGETKRNHSFKTYHGLL